MYYDLSAAKLRFPAAESSQRSEATFSGGWKSSIRSSALRVLHILSGSGFSKHGNDVMFLYGSYRLALVHCGQILKIAQCLSSSNMSVFQAFLDDIHCMSLHLRMS